MLKAGLPAPRRRVLATIALAVLAAHALLLGAVDAQWPLAEREARVATVQVREIAAPMPVVAAALPPVAPAAAPPQAAPAAAPPQPAAPTAPRPRRAIGAAVAVVHAPAELGTLPTPGAPAVATVAAAPAPPLPPAPQPPPVSQPAETSLSLVAVTAALPADTSAEPPVPTYATRLPPSATLRYDLQRGLVGGTGELRWQLDGERYALRLNGTVLGIPVLAQVSQGAIDAAGIAPQRFTDQRARRAPLAANFQRDAHKVTFSGSSGEAPLHDGAQDRLSWMVQLAGIAAADPARREAGTKTALQVVGARGDSSVWVFRCLGAVTVETRAGAVPTLHFVREPRGPYDTGVEVWLDPARHHLPLRATMRNGEGGEVLELRLKDMSVGG